MTREIPLSRGYVAAAKAYDEAAREMYGEFAVLNFPVPALPGYALGNAVVPAVAEHIGKRIANHHRKARP